MKLLFLFIFILIGLNLRFHWIFCTLALLFIAFILLRKKKWKLLLVGIFISFSQFGLSYIQINNQNETYSGVVTESKDNYVILLSNFERIYIYEKDNSYEIGDLITVSGEKCELAFTQIESAFDFQDYLNKKGVYYGIEKPKKIVVSYQSFLKLKKWKKEFLAHFDSSTSAFVSNVLFGESESSGLRDALSSLQLGRLLSISGVYVYAFLVVFNFLLSFLMKDKYSKIISFLLLCVYLVFTFPKLSVIKISILYVLRWINEYVFKKKTDYLTLLCGCALVFLLFDINLARQEGYLLGFILPLFFLLINNSFSFKKKINSKIFNLVIGYLFFVPIQLVFYSEVNILGGIYQIIFTPLMLIYAFVCLLCFFKIPLYAFTNNLTKGIGNIAIPLSKINTSLFAPGFNEALMFIYYLTLLVFIYFVSIRFKPVIRIMSLASICLLALYFAPIGNMISSEVCFINVGQGDSCLVRKGGTTILIDTGGSLYNDIASNCLIPYLKKKRIYKLDYVFITHDDYDHNGALSSLKENFTVKNIISSYNKFPINVSGIEFKNYNLYTTKWKEDNDSSLVIGFNLCQKDFLITGDATTSIEKLIMKDNVSIPCDILKVGHHGSTTSTSQEFLDYLKPVEAIISVGKNYYGHPSSKIISLLKSRNIIIKRTDQIGTISYQQFF